MTQSKVAQNWFNQLSKRFINKSMQEDKLLFTRAKTLFILLVFFLVVLVAYGSFFLVNNLTFNVKTSLNFLGVLAVLLALLLLKKTQKIKYPTRVLNYLGILLITGGVYWSGGLASNDVLWYTIAAIASLLFIGVKDGLIATSISLLAITSFYFVEIFQLFEFPYDELTRGIHYRYANAIIIVVILFFLVLVMVKRNQYLYKIIQDIQNNQVRESISQDFHDELGNKLASIVHISKRLRGAGDLDAKTKMLEAIEKEAASVYDNFRDFIWANDPQNLTLDLLFEHLNDFNQNLFAFENIKVEGKLEKVSNPSEVVLSSKVVRHIIPIFKELMTNVYKHAQANWVNWSIDVKNDKLKLVVVDNGKGFDKGKNISGQGLQNMKKRVKQLNAAFEMEPVLDKGTTFKITVDIKDN